VLEKALRNFFIGLAESFAPIRAFIDSVWLKIWPDTTDELAALEDQFGLPTAVAEADRRANIDAAWKAQGGQSPYYLQSVVQAAGFDLYIHEPWAPALQLSVTCGDADVVCGGGYPCGEQAYLGDLAAIDPNSYLSPGTFGAFFCGDPAVTCGDPEVVCSYGAEGQGYLVNKSSDGRPQPPLPQDPDAWPHFLYWGAETFPVPAEVPAERMAELERLLLQICPAHVWLGLLVTDDAAGQILTEGEYILTDGTDYILVSEG
jgi:hypothetical protein